MIPTPILSNKSRKFLPENFSVTDWPNFGPFIEKAVKQRNDSEDQKVYYVGYPEIPKEELGCDWHPKVAAHRKLADILKPVIKEKLGW